MKAPAFQFYPADFLVGTALFSNEEIGVYIKLLCFQWEHGRVPADLKQIARLAGCPGKKLGTVLSKFEKDANGYYNKRMESERRKQEEYREKQARLARRRWDGNANPDAKASSKPDAVEDNLVMPRAGNALQSPSSVIDRERESTRVADWKESAENAIAACAGAGVQDEFIRRVWLQHDGTTWRDSQGREIVNFKSYVAARFQTERSYRVERNSGGLVSMPAAAPTALRQRWEANDEGLSWNQFREKYQSEGKK